MPRLAPVDLAAASALLAKWRNERDQIQAEMSAAQQSTPIRFDADAVIAELNELEQHLTGDSIPLARTAFQRVFESDSLYREPVSPRRRELVRAEVIPRFPFSLTVESSIRLSPDSVMIGICSGRECIISRDRVVGSGVSCELRCV